jgi:menaquinol-cytochrome c reductase iron-sulfur subunit
MNESTTPRPPPTDSPHVHDPVAISRRGFLEGLIFGLAGLCGAILAVPFVGFILAPLFSRTPEKWIDVGSIRKFVIGQTVNVTMSDPSSLPWAGISAKSAAWLRRESANEFVAFSVNCTHLGCPVRWMEGAELFMCPCHGGVFYKDGTVAAGPPQHPLIRYTVRVKNGRVEILSAPVPITTTMS